MLSVVSFNVNSIRQRIHQLEAVIDRYKPDFIGLQETKVVDAEFPEDDINQLGYQVHYYGQKTHYGVALLAKHDFLSVTKGFPSDTEDSQRRFIAATFNTPMVKEVTLLNGYFPQGEKRDHPTKFANKEKFYVDLYDYLEKHHNPDENIIVLGDMNVSPTDMDIGIGEDNQKRWLRTGKCSFLPEEREWLAKLQKWGLVDVFRQLHPEENNVFSWFDYRSRGFEREPKRGLRIDFVLTTTSLSQKAHSAGIDYDIRGMEKPSDHCPVWAVFQE